MTKKISDMAPYDLGIQKLFGPDMIDDDDFWSLVSVKHFGCFKTITDLSLHGTDCEILSLLFEKLTTLEVDFVQPALYRSRANNGRYRVNQYVLKLDPGCDPQLHLQHLGG